jgi:hypothetical protein
VIDTDVTRAVLYPTCHCRLRTLLCTLEAEVAWRAHGAFLFQGIDEPVAIGEAGFEGYSPRSAPADSAKARRSVTASDELTLDWLDKYLAPIHRSGVTATGG